MIAALLVLAAQLADLAAFGLAARQVGIAGESNVVMAGLSLETIVAVKAAGAVALALLALRLAPRRWALLPALVGELGAVTAILALV